MPRPTIRDFVRPTIEFRDITGWPGYRVGSDGSVWSCLTKVGGKAGKRRIGAEWKELAGSIRKTGYRKIILCDLSGNRRYVEVQILVLEAFVGPRPDGMEACHGDGNRGNNAVENLRWDTRKNNNADKIKHGTFQSKLSPEQVIEVREAFKSPRFGLGSELARRFGVSPAAIYSIRDGESWGHVEGSR